MAARRGRKATEELKRGDSNVESPLLQPEELTVDERQATIVVESQCRRRRSAVWVEQRQHTCSQAA